MLNEKMHGAAIAIQHVIHGYPYAYLDFVLDDRITIEHLVLQVLFECCKHAFDYTSSTSSVSANLARKDANGDVLDDKRMTVQRTIKKINGLREAEYNHLKDEFGIVVDGLLPPDTKSAQGRRKGFSYTDFQHWEINNVHDMELVDAIVKGTITKKNFTYDRMRDYLNAYDREIQSYQQASFASPEESVFASLQFFTLEWKYAIEFYYKIATEMEILGITEVPNLKRRNKIFCGLIPHQSCLSLYIPGIEMPLQLIDSRMLHVREAFIHDYVTAPEGNEFDGLSLAYVEAASLIGNLKTKFATWFIQHSDVHDWASVMNEYNVFSCYNKNKDWTDKKLAVLKKIVLANRDETA